MSNFEDTARAALTDAHGRGVADGARVITDSMRAALASMRALAQSLTGEQVLDLVSELLDEADKLTPQAAEKAGPGS